MSDRAGARHPGVALATLSLCTFVAVTTELLPVGVLPQIAAGMRVSTSTAGLSISVFAVLVAVLAVPMTVFTERVPGKLLLVAVLALYALSNVLAAAAPDFVVLCIGRALGGVAHAVFYSVVTAYARSLVPPHRVGRALSIAFAGASFGAVLGVPATAFLGVLAGWRASFTATAAVAALLAVLVAATLPHVASAPHASGGTRYRRGRGLVGVIVANALVLLGHSTAYTYLAPLLGRAGFSGGALSAVLALLGAVSIGGVVAAGVFGDGHLRWAFTGSAAVIAVTLALLTFGGTAGPFAVADAAVWCLAFGGLAPLSVTAAVRTGAVSDSVAGATMNSASNVGITLGSLLGGGVLTAASLGAVPVVGGVLAAAAAIVAVASRRGFPHGRVGEHPGADAPIGSG